MKPKAQIHGAALVLILGLSGSGEAGWLTFRKDDGLAGNAVAAVIENSASYLWFGTSSGLSKFDGASWTTYNSSNGLPGDLIQGGILEDSSGMLWVGTDQGAARYDGTDWTVFTRANGLAFDVVTRIIEDSKGNIWFGTVNGVSRYNGISWRTFRTSDGLPHNNVRDMIEDSQENLWFATEDGVARYDGAGWRTYTTADGLGDNDTRSILEDPAGNMWFGTQGGVSRFDGQAWVTLTTLDGLPDDMALDILQESSTGLIWFATQSGLAAWDGSGFTVITAADGLADDHVITIAEDSAGALWFGTVNGVSRYDRVAWVSFGIEEGLPSSDVRSVYRGASGTVWIGTVGATGVYDGSILATSTCATGVLTTLEDSRGALWFGTLTGDIYRQDGTGCVPLGPNLGGRVLVSAEDHDGNLWFGTEAGVLKYDGAVWTTYTTADGLADDLVVTILVDSSGAIWFGTEHGATRFDGTNWLVFTIADLLASSDVRDILEDNEGSLWFATAAGVSRLSGRVWTTFTIADGLASNDVLCILQDSRGAMWFGTNGSGLTRFNAGNTGTHRARKDELPEGTVKDIVEDDRGDLWILTSALGISRFTPDWIPPQTAFNPPPPSLSSRTDHFIGFASGYRETGSVRFSHALDGGPWSGWSTQASWTGVLNPGRHTFALRAQDEIGNVDPTPATAIFEIDITPPMAVISSPAFGQAVRDSITILGTASDARFREYVLEFRSMDTPGSWTALNRSSSAVTGDALGVWHTRSVPDGRYELRLTASNRLELTGDDLVEVIVDNTFPSVELTAPATIVARRGGDVYTTTRSAHLYFPPSAFNRDTIVEIAPGDSSGVPASQGPGIERVLPGFAISWGVVPLVKSAILEISLQQLDPEIPREELVIYHSEGSAWARVGGTVQDGGLYLSADIDKPGDYAVYRESTPITSQEGALGTLQLTPRVFSPSGGFSNDRLAISFVLDAPNEVTIKVLTRSGRIIREVASGAAVSAGHNVLYWDGKGSDGRTVHDGLYVVSVVVGGETQVKTVAVVR